MGQNTGRTPVTRQKPIMSVQSIKLLVIMTQYYPATTLPPGGDLPAIYTSGNLNATTSAKSGIQVQQASSLSIVLGLEDVDVTQLQVILITLNKMYAMQQIHTPQPPGMRLLLLVSQFGAPMHMGINVTIGLMLVQVTESVDTPQHTSTILPKNVWLNA